VLQVLIKFIDDLGSNIVPISHTSNKYLTSLKKFAIEKHSSLLHILVNTMKATGSGTMVPLPSHPLVVGNFCIEIG
jgi:hypothetical protein